MSSPRNAITLLQGVITSEDCERLSKSTLIGFLGEVIVKELLEREQKNVTHRGNQSGVDLVYKDGGSIEIDVKTSRLKREFLKNDKNFLHWGWAIREKKRGKNPTHFVFVGLGEACECEAIYVMSQRNLGQLVIADGNRIGQFGNVSHGLLLPRRGDYKVPAAARRDEDEGPIQTMKSSRKLVGKIIKRLPAGASLGAILKQSL